MKRSFNLKLGLFLIAVAFASPLFASDVSAQYSCTYTVNGGPINGPYCTSIYSAGCDDGDGGDNYCYSCQACSNGCGSDGRCISDPPPPQCDPNTYGPDPSTVCNGVVYTQENECGDTQTATGTKIGTQWTPSLSNYCSDQNVIQTNECGQTRTRAGTKNCVQPPIASLSISTLSSLPLGTSFTLRWSSQRASVCSGTGSNWNVNSLSGSQLITPTKVGSLTYSFSCWNSGGSDTAGITVAVQPSECVPGKTSSQSCTTNSCFVGTQTRICDSNGKWGSYGDCFVSGPSTCDASDMCDGFGNCVPDPTQCTVTSWDKYPEDICQGETYTRINNCGGHETITGIKTDGACAPEEPKGGLNQGCRSTPDYCNEGLECKGEIPIGGETISGGACKPLLPIITRLEALPATIEHGATATIAWATSNTLSCEAADSWSGSRNPVGSQSITPSTSGTYTLSCTGYFNQKASKSIQVRVEEACTDNDGDGYGTYCTKGRDCNDDNPLLTNNCFRCGNFVVEDSEQCDEGPTGFVSINHCPSGPVEFTSCDSTCKLHLPPPCATCGDGICSEDESLSICPQDCFGPPSIDFTANGDSSITVTPNDPVKLEWDVKHSTSCTGTSTSNVWNTFVAKGDEVISLSDPGLYELSLECSGQGGKSSKKVSITVSPVTDCTPEDRKSIPCSTDQCLEGVRIQKCASDGTWLPPGECTALASAKLTCGEGEVCSDGQCNVVASLCGNLICEDGEQGSCPADCAEKPSVDIALTNLEIIDPVLTEPLAVPQKVDMKITIENRGEEKAIFQLQRNCGLGVYGTKWMPIAGKSTLHVDWDCGFNGLGPSKITVEALYDSDPVPSNNRIVTDVLRVEPREAFVRSIGEYFILDGKHLVRYDRLDLKSFTFTLIGADYEREISTAFSLRNEPQTSIKIDGKVFGVMTLDPRKPNSEIFVDLDGDGRILDWNEKVRFDFLKCEHGYSNEDGVCKYTEKLDLSGQIRTILYHNHVLAVDSGEITLIKPRSIGEDSVILEVNGAASPALEYKSVYIPPTAPHLEITITSIREDDGEYEATVTIQRRSLSCDDPDKSLFAVSDDGYVFYEGGEDLYVASTVTAEGSSFSDKCVPDQNNQEISSKIIEQGCVEGTTLYNSRYSTSPGIEWHCKNGCLNGACRRPVNSPNLAIGSTSVYIGEEYQSEVSAGQRVTMVSYIVNEGLTTATSFKVSATIHCPGFSDKVSVSFSEPIDPGKWRKSSIDYTFPVGGQCTVITDVQTHGDSFLGNNRATKTLNVVQQQCVAPQFSCSVVKSYQSDSPYSISLFIDRVPRGAKFTAGYCTDENCRVYDPNVFTTLDAGIYDGALTDIDSRFAWVTLRMDEADTCVEAGDFSKPVRCTPALAEEDFSVHPKSGQLGTKFLIKANSIPGDKLDAQIVPFDGSPGKNFPLFDDGSHGDGAANDGVFAAYFDSTGISGGVDVDFLRSNYGIVGSLNILVGEEKCVQLTPEHNDVNANRYNVVVTGIGSPSFQDTFTRLAPIAIDLEEKYSGLMRQEPFRSNRDLFNFWVVPDLMEAPDDVCSRSRISDGPSCYQVLMQSSSSCLLDNKITIGLFESSFRSFAASRGTPVSAGSRGEDSVGAVVTHEIGHVIGKLGDEYEELGVGKVRPEELTQSYTDNIFMGTREECENGLWEPLLGPNCDGDRCYITNECAEGTRFYSVDSYRPAKNTIMRSHTGAVRQFTPRAFSAINERIICNQFEKDLRRSGGICDSLPQLAR